MKCLDKLLKEHQSLKEKKKSFVLLLEQILPNNFITTNIMHDMWTLSII